MKKLSGKILAIFIISALFLGFVSGCSKKKEQDDADFIVNKTWYIGEAELTFSDDGTVEYLIPSTQEKGSMQYEWDNESMSGRLIVEDWTLDMKRDGSRIELLDGSGSKGFLTREKQSETVEENAKDKVYYYGKTECRFAADGVFRTQDKTGTYTWDESSGTGSITVDNVKVDLKKEGSRILLTVDGEEKGILTEKVRVIESLGNLEGQTWYYDEVKCHFKKGGVFEAVGESKVTKGTYTWNDEFGTGTITVDGKTVSMFLMDDVLELEDHSAHQGMLTKLPVINGGK